MSSEWRDTVAREAGWVARHPHQLAYVVHLAAGAGVVYGGLSTSTQSLIVDGLALAASLLAQLAATRATAPLDADGAFLVPKGTISSPDVSTQ